MTSEEDDPQAKRRSEPNTMWRSMATILLGFLSGVAISKSASHYIGSNGLRMPSIAISWGDDTQGVVNQSEVPGGPLPLEQSSLTQDQTAKGDLVDSGRTSEGTDEVAAGQRDAVPLPVPSTDSIPANDQVAVPPPATGADEAAPVPVSAAGVDEAAVAPVPAVAAAEPALAPVPAVAAAEPAVAPVPAVGAAELAAVPIPITDADKAEPIGPSAATAASTQDESVAGAGVQMVQCGGKPCNGTCNAELQRCDTGYYYGERCPREEKYCFLPRGKYGPFTEPYSTFCYGDCSLQGTCENGFCRCNPGYWGVDCGLSHDAQGGLLLYGKPEPAEVPRPSFYIYDIPPMWTVFPRVEGFVKDKLAMNYLFLELMLRSVHRTLDPKKADFFYAPGMGDDKILCVGCPSTCATRGLDLMGEHGAAPHLGLRSVKILAFLLVHPAIVSAKTNAEGVNAVPDFLSNSTFLDMRGPIKKELNLRAGFRVGLDVRIPQPLSFGRSFKEYQPLSAKISTTMVNILQMGRDEWPKKLTEGTAEIAQRPLLVFVGYQRPLCGLGTIEAPRICFNSSNMRALVHNLFRKPDIHYSPNVTEVAPSYTMPCASPLSTTTLM
ncbi:hypothetical protein CYMTET_25621 [Cymbomonas tetramitiformis]|uniref:Uncharacterized protein n=1 Tax=Cymbomonas tetramitiformis TaxID=36881 RepID=A0AAE0FU29_9CHLO|nr:hypothetical protein CYMTET_25621 [Cymbomonas tetramitiformis]